MPSPLFFYSHRKKYGEFSQFYPSKFQVDGYKYNSAEQYMMAQKAKIMGDKASFSKIMNESNPIKIKCIGRCIRPWDNDRWEKNRFKIVLDGNMYKFSQNAKLAQKLQATGTRTIAEATPKDKTWGIGISFQNAVRGDAWKGKNLLGKVLMIVRKKTKRRNISFRNCDSVRSQMSR